MNQHRNSQEYVDRPEIDTRAPKKEVERGTPEQQRANRRQENPGDGESGVEKKSDSPEWNSQTIAESTKEAAHQIKEEVSREADLAMKRLKDEGQKLFSRQKDRAAEGLSKLTAVIDKTAGTLREEGDHAVADYAEAIGGKVKKASRYLQENELGTFTRKAEKFARRRPELFLGGMFIAGLALARYLRSSETAFHPPRSLGALATEDPSATTRGEPEAIESSRETVD